MHTAYLSEVGDQFASGRVDKLSCSHTGEGLVSPVWCTLLALRYKLVHIYHTTSMSYNHRRRSVTVDSLGDQCTYLPDKGHNQ